MVLLPAHPEYVYPVHPEFNPLHPEYPLHDQWGDMMGSPDPPVDPPSPGSAGDPPGCKAPGCPNKGAGYYLIVTGPINNPFSLA